MESIIVQNSTKEKALQKNASNMKKLNNFWKLSNKYKVLTFMALPAIIYFFINNYLPIFGLFIAFKRIDFRLGIWKSPWAGLQNFKFLFSSSDAFLITRNTVGFNLIFIILGTLLAITVAILLNELGGSLKSKFYQTSFIVPFMVSYTVVGYVVYAFLSPDYGIANQIMTHWFGQQAVDWYLEASKWPVLLVIINLWKVTGYSTILYLAAIVGIDGSYYEAAVVDGAGQMSKIRYITLPMLVPISITLVLLAIGRIFYADFGLFYQATLASKALLSVTNVIDVYVYNMLITTGDMGMSSAAGFYQSIVGFILVLLSNLLVRKISSENALF
jgi:putative aldouronate transport system permease protein